VASFLDGYETVNQKVQRLHATFPTNRIETSIVKWDSDKGYILVECRIFRHFEDEKPAAIDFAHGMVGAYNPQMKRWYVEDTVSSAIGRCASVVLGTETKPPRESMEQVETMPKTFVDEDPWSKPIYEDGFHTAASVVEQITSQLGGEILAEAPICKHGHMILKEGTKANGDQYKGYVCPERVKANQCKAQWLEVKQDGKWGTRS
jgi:hypothetical protein